MKRVVVRRSKSVLKTTNYIMVNTSRHLLSYSTSSSSDERYPLVGRRAIVTGSTSGIGLAIAETFVENGASVVINGLHHPSSTLEYITKHLEAKIPSDLRSSKSTLPQIISHQADLTSTDQISDLFKHAKDSFGGIDILVNNAGVQYVCPTVSYPLDKWNLLLAINLTAVFYASQLALPFMLEQKYGRIINISSVHGLVASKNKAPYVASKHGVVGLTKAIALETAGTGVTCNCINPGWVKTLLVEEQIKARAQEQGIDIPKAEVSLLEEKQPSKQFVLAQDLAKTAMFLCSDAANQITGISIPVDGGWTAQ